MVIISDTTAITNLLVIDEIHVLKKLYGRIIIPKAVREELVIIEHHDEFLTSCDWIEVADAKNIHQVRNLLMDLDRGEAEAIVLAKEQKADYLIIDELKGRIKAKEFGISVIGLLGVLVDAKKNGIIPEVKPLMNELADKANFFIHPSLFEKVLKLANEYY